MMNLWGKYELGDIDFSLNISKKIWEDKIMKRLALLLAAMGIVSVGAMAEAPKLEVVSVGQNI